MKIKKTIVFTYEEAIKRLAGAYSKSSEEIEIVIMPNTVKVMSTHKNAKITEEMKNGIIDMLKNGSRTGAEIASHFQVSTTTVSIIKKEAGLVKHRSSPTAVE